MGLFDKFKNALSKTREVLGSKIAAVFTPGRKLDENLIEELEEVLLTSDVGLDTTDYLIARLRETHRQNKSETDGEALLRREIATLLHQAEGASAITQKPHVVLVVGVNGTGKTTSVGKLGKFFANQGKSVIYAAADTFRAAAIDQLKIWGERSGIPVVSSEMGGDSAAVAFDALNAALTRNSDVLVIDTAGRLHNKANLMHELEKVSRVLKKKIPDAPHEVLLVLDATTGQNGLNQAKEFSKASGITGLILTKLDGTAKGGVVLGISRSLGIPIRYIGFGESIDDFAPFDAEKFTEGLLGTKSEPLSRVV